MVYAVYFVVIWRTVYALADLVSRLAVVVIFWLSVHIFCGHGCCIFGQVLHLWMVFIGFMQLCCRNFSNYKKKKGDGWCILLLVNVRMDLIWLCFMDIGVYIGLFHIRNLGSRVLGMRGRDSARR